MDLDRKIWWELSLEVIADATNPFGCLLKNNGSQWENMMLNEPSLFDVFFGVLVVFSLQNFSDDGDDDEDEDEDDDDDDDDDNDDNDDTCWWFRNPKQPPGMYTSL